MHTYGLSDDKVITTIVDVVIIIDKIGRGDVPFGSQTIACLARGGRDERANGIVLSRAQMTTDREGVTACWHKKKKSLVYFAARTQEPTIYPGVHRLYLRQTYTRLLSDRGASIALPTYEEQDVSKRQGGTLLGTYLIRNFSV
jgi:hypothetical protein